MTTPYSSAYMGYVGFVRFQANNPFNATAMTIRATTADIMLKQEIMKPDVIDSRYDKTVYQLGPQEVGGAIGFPAVYDMQGGGNVVATLFKYVAMRDQIGNLYPFSVDVKYAASTSPADAADFTFGGCIINSWKFSVTNKDYVKIDTDIIGLTRNPATFNNDWNFNPVSSSSNNYATENTRIVTWADARFELISGKQQIINSIVPSLNGSSVRSFEVSINNNAERFYTLNGQLYPQAVAPTKRDITGTIVLMGRNNDLGSFAASNQTRSYEDSCINFGFTTTSSSGVSNAFGTKLPNIVFQIEEMSLTKDLFESTVKWHSLPAAGIYMGPTGSSNDPLIANLNNITWSN